MLASLSSSSSTSPAWYSSAIVRRASCSRFTYRTAASFRSRREYSDWPDDQYPDGVADGVGYWAEDRSLGGVVLFDRRQPESSNTIYYPVLSMPADFVKEADAIHFHTNANDVSYRIYRLRNEQKQQLLQFLLAETSAAFLSCPLPIHGDERNSVRIDPEEHPEETGIYRDRWERKLLTDDDGDWRTRDVVIRLILCRETNGWLRVSAVTRSPASIQACRSTRL